MTDIEARAKAIIKRASSKLSPITYLSGRVRNMEREDVDQLAIAYLFAQVKTRKRAEVLEVEREAQIERAARFNATRPPALGSPEWDAWASKPENAARAAEVIKRRDEHEDRMAEIDRQFRASWDRSMSELKSAWRMEWTDELLASTFALGDGTEVTWGAATREQHEYRFRMHQKHARAGMEGAARHQQAIETLDATGASTLSEAIGVAA